MGEIIIRYIDMPNTVKAYTATDSNDDYNIYINANLCWQAQEQAKRHELEHIKKKHFFSSKPVKVCEDEVS